MCELPSTTSGLKTLAYPNPAVARLTASVNALRFKLEDAVKQRSCHVAINSYVNRCPLSLQEIPDHGVFLAEGSWIIAALGR